jgi:hypothetical protein
MPAIERRPQPTVQVAPFSFVTLAFGPPANPLKVRATTHHAVHWNKAREMMRPFGFAEVEGSAVILGDGQGSVITFKTRGAPVIPQPIQDWLKAIDPPGFKAAASIAKVAAGVLAAISKLFGVPQLGAVAAGAAVVIGAVEDAIDGDS